MTSAILAWSRPAVFSLRLPKTTAPSSKPDTRHADSVLGSLVVAVLVAVEVAVTPSPAPTRATLRGAGFQAIAKSPVVMARSTAAEPRPMMNWSVVSM